MGGFAKNLLGQVFGRLTVISRSNNDKWNNAKWLCRCECGNEKIISGQLLRNGEARSCGCIKRKHGQSNTPTYRSWMRMRERCCRPGDKRYKDYGGRGIIVCDRWRNSFENFFADMGERPSSKHSIDRIDVNGNYEPGNCRWSTTVEQRHNRRDSK